MKETQEPINGFLRLVVYLRLQSLQIPKWPRPPELDMTSLGLTSPHCVHFSHRVLKQSNNIIDVHYIPSGLVDAPIEMGSIQMLDVDKALVHRNYHLG